MLFKKTILYAKNKKKYLYSCEVIVSFLILFVFNFIPFPLITDVNGESKNNVLVEIDITKKVGELSPLFSTGVFLSIPEVGYPLERYFGDHKKLGLHEIGIIDEFRYNKDIRGLDDFRNRLVNSNGTKWAVKVKENGGEVLVLLGLMPYWMSSRPDSPQFERYPPRSYDEWAEAVRVIVDLYNNRLKLDARYVVWDEPEGYWKGSEEDYHKLYKYSVIGAKHADKNVKIGGPSVSPLLHLSRENNRPWIENLMDYCSKTKLPEFGLDKLPIDFLSWHNFDGITYTSRLKRSVEKAKELFVKYRYNANTELIISSWNSWLDYRPPDIARGNEYSKERDTEYLSAFLLPTLMTMEEAGVTRQVYFDLLGTWQNDGSRREFSGTTGLFTKHHVIKPIYNAFIAMGMLGKNRVEVGLEDPFIRAVATSDEDKTVLIIANFIPEEDVIILEKIAEGLKKRGYSQKDLDVINKRIAKGIIAGNVKIKDLDISRVLKKDLEEIFNYYKEIISRRKESSVETVINLKGLKPGRRYRSVRYLIDSGHSNSFIINEKVEAAIKDAKRKAREEAEHYLSSRGFTDVEIKRIVTAYGTTKLKGSIRNLSEYERNELQTAQNIVGNSFSKNVDQINEWNKIKLQRIEEKLIDGRVEYEDILPLTPHSVNVIMLSAE